MFSNSKWASQSFGFAWCPRRSHVCAALWLPSLLTQTYMPPSHILPLYRIKYNPSSVFWVCPRSLLPVGRARKTFKGRQPGGMLMKYPNHLSWHLFNAEDLLSLLRAPPSICKAELVTTQICYRRSGWNKDGRIKLFFSAQLSLHHITLEQRPHYCWWSWWSPNHISPNMDWTAFELVESYSINLTN